MISKVNLRELCGQIKIIKYFFLSILKMVLTLNRNLNPKGMGVFDHGVHVIYHKQMKFVIFSSMLKLYKL